MNLKITLATVILALPATPAFADDGGTAIFGSASFSKHVPSQLKRSQQALYRSLFQAMEADQWETAKQLLSEAPNNALKPIAKAEFFLAANSPRAELGPLLVLVNEAPHIPQAAQLGRLATRRGAQLLPDLPQRRKLSYFPAPSIRSKPKSIRNDAKANEIRGQVLQFIKTDRPKAAEDLLNVSIDALSSDAATELQQRIAWSYYIENDDRAARQMAQRAQNGSGSWVVHADWVAGLSSWRLKDCQSAATAFNNVSRRADSSEFKAAGYYWAARADLACGRPENVQAKLKSAAKEEHSFYGLLAAEKLAMDSAKSKAIASFEKADWKSLKRYDNVKAAIALTEIGQDALADEVLRHQARIGNGSDHPALLKLAKELSLPRTQLWLAHNAPRGFRPDSQARFPAPKWRPDGGWRVDPALVYAHTLQESAFRSRAVSPANAIGLMQVRPGTASDIARANGHRFSKQDLFEPSTNLEYGQSYLEYLSKSSITGGKLPKVAAAYNAGPSAVQRWNTELRDNDDPLLFMESIPFVETRGYVSIIMRNYWTYEQQAGIASQSRKMLAQNEWPKFPAKPTKAKLRLAQR